MWQPPLKRKPGASHPPDFYRYTYWFTPKSGGQAGLRSCHNLSLQYKIRVSEWEETTLPRSNDSTFGDDPLP